MRCPFCKCKDTQVVDSRLNSEGSIVKRRRKCSECESRFNTFESIELIMPLIIKSSGGREEFNDGKIKASLLKALHKRPVGVEQIDEVIENIKQEILLLNKKEIDSKMIGDLIMNHLKNLDNVAFIRFASVYRSFQDIKDFNEIIRQVINK